MNVTHSFVFQIGEVFSQMGLFHRWDFLHRSWRSQIGGVFSQMGFFHSWDFLH